MNSKQFDLKSWLEERKENNEKVWEEAKKEYQSALDMFNYATEPFYIELAITQYNIAIAKLDAIRSLMEHEGRIIEPIKLEERKKTLVDRLIEYIQEPYNDLIDIIKMHKEEKNVREDIQYTRDDMLNEFFPKEDKK